MTQRVGPAPPPCSEESPPLVWGLSGGGRLLLLLQTPTSSQVRIGWSGKYTFDINLTPEESLVRPAGDFVMTIDSQIGICPYSESS